MAQNLTQLEPIPAPDPRRPTQTPQLPAWLATMRANMASNLQIDQATGRFADTLTLPADRIPTEEQRAEIQAHMGSLDSLLDQAPAKSGEWEKATLVIVTRTLLALASHKNSEASADAKAEAYMAALDDVPWWAVDAAVRAWYRGECGKDHDYRWAPDPATLRRLASIEAMRISARLRELQNILDAKPFVDCSAELERGQAAYAGLMSVQDPNAKRALSFEEAIALGRKVIAETGAVPKASEAA